MEIETKQMGEVWVASCGENVAIGISEEEAVKNIKFQLKILNGFVKRYEGVWKEQCLD